MFLGAKGKNIMAKKTKEEAQQTRKKLTDSAIRRFHEKGYSNTTLADIATDAGLTRGALYWHFKGKAEIFISIYDDFIGKVDKIATQTIDREDATLDEVLEFVKKTNTLLVTDSEFAIALEVLLFRAELSEELKIIEDRDSHWVNSHLDTISLLIGNHIKENNLKLNIESREIALSIVAMCRGVGLLYSANKQIFPHADSHLKIVDSYFESILSKDIGSGRE